MTVKVADPRKNQYEHFQNVVLGFRNSFQRTLGSMSAGTFSADDLKGLTEQIAQAHYRIDNFLGITGIVQYIKDYEADQTYDVSVEMGTLKTKMDAIITEVQARYPTCGIYLEGYSWNGAVISPRVLTSAATSTIQPLVQAVITHLGG